MATQLEIYQLALDAVGTRSSVSSITEKSSECDALNRQYDNARKTILIGANWGFCRRQAALALLADASQGQAVPVPWMYEYAPPADMLNISYLMPQVNYMGDPGQMVVAGPRIPHLVSTDADSSGNPISVILTNQANAIAVYTLDLKDTSLFPNEFVNAFSLYLAARVCLTLTGDKALKGGLEREAQSALRDAELSASNSDSLTVISSTPDWITGRGSSIDPTTGNQLPWVADNNFPVM